MKNIFYIRSISVLMLLAFAGLLSCKQRPEQDKVSEDKQEHINVPIFSADSAYYFIERQVEFGPRVPGTKGWELCAAYLSNTLERFGAEVIVQEATARVYDGTIIPIKNIIGTWQPDNNRRVMLCAHWDTRPYADWDPDPSNFYNHIDGANDGGSGVGVLLEVARHLSKTQPDVGIDIIFFDAEDWGEPRGHPSRKAESWGLGSQYWSNNPHKKGYFAKYGILLDMVGAKDAIFYHEGYSVQYAEHIVKKVWDIAHKIGYGKYFSNERSHPVIDDHYFVNLIMGLPTINIIHQDKSGETGFFKYWHTMEDTMDKIGKETLKAVGQTVLHVIYTE